MGNELQIFDKKTLEQTEKRVREMQENGELDLPSDYSAQNALKSAWLQLQQTKDKSGKPVLENCTRASVMEAMLDTVIQGLNPAKDQVYFIAYGNTLTAQRSYFGDIYLAKRLANVKEVNTNLMYEGDEITIENEQGRQKVVEHKQSFKGMQENSITGAYAVVVFNDDRDDRYTIMTRDELEAAWEQGRNWNKEREDDPHNKFTGEMARKTVIHRACKSLINSSGDSHLFQEAINRADVERAKQERDQKVEEIHSETIELEPEDVDSETDVEKDEDPEVDQENEGNGGPDF